MWYSRGNVPPRKKPKSNDLNVPDTHSTTKNAFTFVRTLFLLASSMVLAMLVPYVPGTAVQVTAVTVGVFLAVSAATAVFAAVSSKRTLEEHLYVELNKVRRIYHLALHLSKENKALANWFSQMEEALWNYLTFFEDKVFSKYSEGGSLFREVTYRIYGLPVAAGSYNAELYAALVATAGQATEAREYIRRSLGAAVGRFERMVLVATAVCFSAALTLATPLEFGPRLLSAAATFVCLLSVQLAYEYDRINAIRDNAFADLYLDNLKQLSDLRGDLGRSEQPAKR